MKVDVTQHILNFRELLCDIANSVDNLMDNHDWDNDSIVINWVNVNWELLVGKAIFKDQHSITQLVSTNPHWKILPSKKKADYTVVAFSKNADVRDPLKNEPIPIQNGIRIIGFSSIVDNIGYGLYPPFDIADLYNEKTRKSYAAKINDLQFFAMPYDVYLLNLFYPETPRPGLL